MSGVSTTRRLAILLLVPAVVGCANAARPVSDGPVTVAIAPETQFAVPRAAELGRPVDAVQQVTARRENSVYVFEVRVQAGADQLRLIGTDPAGRRAMTINWTDGRLAVERAPWLPDTVRPENILADLMLIFWPDESVRRALIASGATLSVEANGRTVRRGDRELVTVRYDRAGEPWSGLVRLRNMAWGYELEIRSVTVTP